MTDPLLLKLLSGFILAVLIAYAAWKIKTLNLQGALAAALLGTIIFGLGGLGWAILLMGFFISSSLLSRLFKHKKARLEEKFSKGSQRDAGQVAANGGIAGFFVLLHLLWPDAIWPWVGYAGALAAANADTWATELGVLNPSAPRLITTGRMVERGTSGGISPLGLLSALCGSLVIALLAVIFWQGQVINLPTSAPTWILRILGSQTSPLPFAQALAWVAWITLSGLAGSLIDSLLGATVQAIYTCPACRKETERYPIHTCGTPTTLLRGWTWLNNDWVNMLCTLTGAATALIFSIF